MYQPILGTFLSRDPLPPDGDPVVLGTSLYNYVRNNPINLIDPSGLAPEPPGGPAAAKPEKFYVCERLVQVGGLAEACGCQHTDIYGDQSGEVYTGFGGASLKNNNGLPKGPGWKCTELQIVANKTIETGIGGGSFKEIPLSIKWGPKSGQSCKNATSSDVLACLQAKPKPPGTPGLISNCQTDVYGAAQDCCLIGFTPISLIPVTPLPIGPKL